MPFGSTAVGFTAFVAVKLAGYSWAGSYVRHRFGATRPHPLLFGLTRTLIGILVGVGVASLFMTATGERSYLFYLLLAPIWFLEWYLVLALFYSSPQSVVGASVDSTLNLRVEAVARHAHFSRLATLGILLSFVLDIPAFLSVFLVPSGAWIC